MEDEEVMDPTTGLVELLTNQYGTTEEGLDYARRLLDRELQTETYYPEEEEILSEYEKSAETAKQTLRDARARLLARRYGPGEALLAAAAGFGAPTRTGAFGETLGTVAGNLIQPLSKKRAWEEERDTQRLELESGMSAIDRQLLAARLQLAGLTRKTRGQLATEALKTLGRPLSSSRGQISNYGKIARDEGYTPGSPEFNQRVNELRNEDYEVNRVQAGMDEEQIPAEEREATAYNLGVPLASIDPYAGLSRKSTDKVRSSEMRRAEKFISDQEETTAAARKGIGYAKRFLAALPKVPDYELGPIQGKNPFPFSAAGQEVDAMQAEIARTMRVPGEGSTSNFDAQQFRKASFGRDKDRTPNKNIVSAYLAQKERELERVSFYEDYYDLNGHIRGANTEWQEYLDNNPIFDPQKPQEFLLNENRKDYRDYFREKLREVLPEETEEVPGTSTGKKFARGGPVGMQEGGQPQIEDEDDAEAYQEMMQMLRAGVQGGTLGFGDELMGALAPGELAPDVVSQEREKYRQSLEESPLGTMAAQAGGAGLTADLLERLSRATGLSKRMLARLPRAQLLLLLMEGAGAGAVAGMGGEESAEGRMIAPLYGAAYGAGTGALTGLAAKYGLSGAEDLYDRLRGQRVSPAERRVIQAMEAERETPQSVATRVQRGRNQGVPLMAGDVGPRMRGLTETALRKAGEASTRYTEDLAARQEGSRGRVSDVVNRSLKPMEYFGEMDTLKNELYSNAKPLYEAAYKQYEGGIESKALIELIQTPSGKEAIKRAMRFMKDKRKPIGRADALGMVRKPTLEFLDEVKRGFDQLIRAEESSTPNSPQGKILKDMRGQLLRELDAAAPEYKAARAEYAGDLEVLNALKAGRENFSKMQPEEIKRYVSGMSRGEKEAFRTGVSQKLYEMLDGPTANINAARKLIGSPAMKAKLELLFDRPREYKIFEEALKKEMELFEHSGKMLRAGIEAQGRDIAGEQIRELATAPRSGVFWTALNMLRRLPTMTEKTANEILNIVHSGTPSELARMEQQLTTKANRLAGRRRRAGRAAGIAAIAGGALTQPAPYDQEEEDAENP